jgi:hypothetical protein
MHQLEEKVQEKTPVYPDQVALPTGEIRVLEVPKEQKTKPNPIPDFITYFESIFKGVG